MQAPNTAAPDQTEATLTAWVTAQLLPWRRYRLNAAAVESGLDALNRDHDHFFIFEIADATVRLRHTPHYTPAQLEHPADSFTWRAGYYLAFFRRVAERRPTIRCVLGMSMHDPSMTEATVPTFAFQKPSGTLPILLPDIDAIRYEFYAPDPPDDVPFRLKHTRAVFAGSTTGQMHTVQSIAARTNPRLRACLFFRPHAEMVDFTLPNIVQCETPAAEAALHALHLGTTRTPWPEQLANKFILSMDGNGATCSRVALTLRSRAVLLKYDSPHELYYFGGLVPGRHYIPIANDADVLAILREEQQQPNRFQPIAQESRQFFREFLTLAPTLSYTAKLLNRYMRLFGFAGPD